MSAATTLASPVVNQWFTNSPITSVRRVNRMRGTRAKGIPQVACHNDPEQQIPVACARLNIGREVARVDIGDAGDKRRAEEREEATNEAFLALPTEYESGGASGVGITRSDFSCRFLRFRWHGVISLVIALPVTMLP